MGFLKALKEFFASLFNSNSPEAKKKQELRAAENELKLLNPVLYKGGYIQPNFAELLRILYENAKPIENILGATTNSPDQKRNWRYKRELIISGFSPESKEKLENLSYENRLEKVLTSPHGADTALATQRKNLEDLVRDLNSRELISIDHVLADIDHLAAICKHNYMTAIRTFDPSYDTFAVDYKPNFSPIVPEALESTFLDLYYIFANFKITTSLASAVLAAAELKNMGPLSQEEKDSLMGNLKKINSILKRNLTADVLKNFAIVAQKNPEVDLKVATYKPESRQQFATSIEDQFRADEARIKSELKDRNIASELKELFGEMPLSTLKGYNADINRQIKENSAASFLMMTPMQVLKTFVLNFLPESTMMFLNNIVVEGFFNNNDYKSDFSQIVFTAAEIPNRIAEFEKCFEKGQKFDQGLILGYIKDSHINAEFVKDLTKMVDNINIEAKSLIQQEATNIAALTKKVQDLIADCKKTSPDTISNVKVLATSSRNRDAYEILEKNFPTWKNFLTVMKNYVIIGDSDKKKQATNANNG